MQGKYLSTYATSQGTDLLSFRFVTGVLLFISGLLINTNADDILRGLRKPGETGYKIPRVCARP
jgi:3-oxo-5-alpha-steroid 4-dehydrogenase 1